MFNKARGAVKSKIEFFLTILKDWIPLTIAAKSSVNMAGFLNSLLELLYLICKFSITRVLHEFFGNIQKQLLRVAKLRVLKVLAECGKTACEAVCNFTENEFLHCIFKAFLNNFSNIL